MRVAIVDDDLWIRTGRQTALGPFDDIEVAASLTPDEAQAFDWDGIDMAVVDAHDPSRDWDQFPGVAVVEAIRRQRDHRQTVVIVISGRIFDPMLRLRMAEAGADYFYGHLDVSTPDALAGLLRQPDPARKAHPGDDTALAGLGLRAWSTPNQALNWLAESGADRYFTPSGTQKAARASRRTLDRVRDQVAQLAHLDPSLDHYRRRPGEATWRDVARFVQRALGHRSD